MKRNKKMNIVLSAHVAVNRTEMGVDFVHKPRKRSKPVLKLPHSSVSYGEDGFDRFTFTLPSSQRSEFSRLLLEEAYKAGRFVAKNYLV